MTTPRRTIPKLAFIAVMLVTTMAFAGGRKRVVVLDLEGPKAEKFHDDIVSILKKSHIVVPTSKWNSTAEFMDAAAASDGNFKKIAKKLKIDAIISGKIEKRRDEYIIRLKLRAGASGEVVGNGVDTKAEGPRVDGKSSKDIKDELLSQIESLEGGHGGGSPASSEDDEDDKPVAKTAPTVKKDDPKKKVAAKKSSDDDEDDAPVAKKAPPPPAVKKEDPKKKVAAKKSSDDDDEDDAPAKKTPAAKKEDPKKKVAAKKSSDDDEDDAPTKKAPAAKKSTDDDEDTTKKGGDDEDGKKKVAAADEDGGDATSVTKDAGGKPVGAEMLTPAHRGADVVVGLTLTQRTFSFTSTLDATKRPPGYKGALVPAAFVDATLYPLGFSHGGGALANLGIGGTFERVLGLQSQITNPDGNVVKEPTTEQRYEIAISYRFPFASGGMAAVKLGYGAQSFKITHGADAVVDIPDVAYTGVTPSAMLRYPLGSKLYLDLDAGVMLLTSAGQIQNNDQYGQATALGIAGGLGIDYMLTKNIFARVMGRYETVGLTFKGTGTMSTSRDNDPMTQDVSAARDNYLGGSITVGYAY